MTAVRCGVEDDVLGPPLHAALERGLQGFVGGVVVVEGQVVAKQDETMRGSLEQGEQGGQRVDVLAVDLDQAQTGGVGRVDGGVRGLDQRRLAHAARAPQQHVVGRVAVGETLRVVDQDVAHTVDALDQVDLDPIDPFDWCQHAGFGFPHEAVGGAEIGRGRRRRCQLRHRRDQPV